MQNAIIVMLYGGGVTAKRLRASIFDMFSAI